MTETPVTEIILVDADTYVGIYVNGELYFWGDRYDLDFDYGLELGAANPDYSLTYKDVDFEWLDAIGGGNMPEKLEDVKFA
jgi:hypothetical protein